MTRCWHIIITSIVVLSNTIYINKYNNNFIIINMGRDFHALNKAKSIN